MTKRVVVQVRVSVEEKSAWGRWAADEGVSLSELIRRVMVERLAPVEVPGSLVGAEGHGAQGDPATTENEADLSRGVGLGHAGLKQPSVPTSVPRFVVPASCPAPSKKTFKPDFK